MLHLPRLAFGSAHPGVDQQPMCWALWRYCPIADITSSIFTSTACFSQWDGAVASTGATSRHLDSWLMTPETCREAFVHNAGKAQCSIVEWAIRQRGLRAPLRGGQLDDPLRLARPAARGSEIDASRVNGCTIPARPENIDALLLDRIKNPRHFR